MIVFDLKCPQDHVFEAWFRDSGAFDRQAKAGKVTCPSCGSTKVSKALMAPNIASRKEKSSAEQREAASKTVKLLRELRQHVEKNCDYVGERFAEEAKRIHYGETSKRSIYGEATPEQAKDLLEEGIEFGQIPWVPPQDS
jgi:hypothetical protein